MNQSEYFRNKVATYLSCLSNSALNAGTDVARTIVAFEIATPYTPQDYQNALTAWLQGRHDTWQSRIDAYESNPTNENLAATARLALSEHQDFDDIVATAYSLAVDKTLIENEIEKRRNNGE